jgi:hypothetical protein
LEGHERTTEPKGKPMNEANNKQPRPKIDSVDDLEKILADQNEAILKLGNLIVAMDARIKLLTDLVDAHHTIFVRQGFCKPTGGEYASGQKTN